MNEKEKIISVIWHELGHVFICVCEGASIKTLEFSKRGNYDNSGIRENTFGGLTCFEDEISNKEIYFLKNSNFFLSRILNLFAGSIFEAIYLNSSQESLFRRGGVNSDYENLKIKSKKFKEQNGKNCDKILQSFFPKLDVALGDEHNLFITVNSISNFLYDQWKSNNFNNFEVSGEISLKIQDLLLKEISFKFLNEIQKMKIDFKNHIKEN